ncbi:MAG: hypothetical protein NC311_16220 [Muribaculaceae bacterium]|nr:hypothetical protein [Muribaculaceae bacterium]MCM1488901.1 hypothetical protein [Bacillota bacterium]
MRNLMIALLFVFMILTTGCRAKAPPESDSEIPSEITSEEQLFNSESVTTETVSTSETSEISESNSEAASDRRDYSQTSEPELPTADVASDKPSQSASDAPAPTKPDPPPTVSEQPKPTPPSEPEPAASDLPDEPVQPKEPNAGAADTQAVADKVLAYINQYRFEQGCPSAVKLSGLTRYAEYRSGQLVSNFAHDTADERAAATALQYGQYVDPPLYGMTGEPYYTVNVREAIGMGGYAGTIDEVAKSLARLIKNSPGHWAYVGSAEYGYIGVGVTCRNDMWYCDIAMAQENTDEK